MLNKIIKYFLDNKLITALALLIFVAWGIVTAPFNWENDFLPTDPVPVDAIPDIGENQQIVFTQWPGRSPQDIEDQISYPLTTYLLGIPGVKSIRSNSIFGYSSIYIIFNEETEFYWSRSRILEKLNSIPSNLLPESVQPTLGPDATALGQVFWYTLEGRSENGEVTGGWDLQELRSIQDFQVKYSLNAVEGVSEVASIGGFVKEYQVDVNPDALKVYSISLNKVVDAIRKSNKDVGAKTLEINQAEYLVRGLGYIKSIEDIESAVVGITDNVPIRVKDIARVSLGPATRRGILDKGGAEVVGGVVVARYGSNPLQVINNVKKQIAEISKGLPQKTLSDGSISKLTIVPFYDRSTLIKETLGTLEEALSLEILITILVVIIMVFNLRASLLISALLPISVLMVFIAMRYVGVDANIVALSGIAIAIGTMVDLGIILSENMLKHQAENTDGTSLKSVIFNASSEVSSAILTAVATTIVSFIPVFTLQAAEGKLFRPLAFTKTFALLAALVVALFILPTLAQWFFGFKINKSSLKKYQPYILMLLSVVLLFFYFLPGLFLFLYGISFLVMERFPTSENVVVRNLNLVVVAVAISWFLASYWQPLGVGAGVFFNLFFVGIILLVVIGGFMLLERNYSKILGWCLDHKKAFLTLPVLLILFGVTIWLGFGNIFGFIPKSLDGLGLNVRTTAIWSKLNHALPGIGKEFMPSLDEGSFLLMPTSMPHSGVAYNRKVVGQLDMLVGSIPEVDMVVGKLGRVESALDPAPVSMYENVINYKSEYIINEDGHRLSFKVNGDGEFAIKDGSFLSHQETIALGIKKDELIEEDGGQYFRNWREHIMSPDDIWDEIVKVAKIPGVTSAPKLQPIETRLVMLQTGMRAPMGLKVYGPDLETIEAFGLKLEAILKEVPSVKAEAAFADRIVGKPYLHLNIDRERIGRYGLNIADVQMAIETAIGGMPVTTTVEGRERYQVRVRYPRELRDSPETIDNILVSTPSGTQIPLGQLVTKEYMKGPQSIKSENTFLVGYVLFDKREGYSEVGTVEDAAKVIQDRIDEGTLVVPTGISYKFSGSYENQVRAEKRLSIIVPIVLLIVFIILYMQFKSVGTSLMVFVGIALAFSGGFIMIWLYGQSWFADITIGSINFRDIFQIQSINLSVAVWVGFIALFGIATDDGVLMATYLDQSFARNTTKSATQIRQAVIEAGKRRIKPAVMTSVTTIIALLPVLTSTGKGADIMVPMAIPAVGGMILASITYFIVPVLYGWRAEYQLKKNQHATI